MEDNARFSKTIDVSKGFLESAPPEDEADRVIADALNQLSLNEREKVFQEIHGVADDVEETPQIVDRSLAKLDIELARIKQGNSGQLPTAAYLLAESMSPEYVQDRKLRLSFLRTDDFNERLAAERMVRFFDFKFSFFGGNLLVKDITFPDLGVEAEFVEKGIFQFLPERDRAGRPVLLCFPAEQEYTRFGSAWTDMFTKVLFYTVSMINDETLQKKGTIIVTYGAGVTDFKEFDPMVPSIIYRSIRSLPVKIASQHYCFSTAWFRIIVQNMLHMSLDANRVAVKIHQGSQQEVMYSLMTYGIPTSDFPITFDNAMKRGNHKEMLEMQRKKEIYLASAESKDLDFVMIPDNFDVLYGKGQTNHQRPGNMRLKSLVDEMLPLQSALTNRAEKVALAQQIVDTFKMEGGRFLSKDSGVWMAVNDDVARTKVANLFRNRRKAAAQKPAPKQQTVAAGARPTHHERGSFFLTDTAGSGDKKRPKFSAMQHRSRYLNIHQAGSTAT